MTFLANTVDFHSVELLKTAETFGLREIPGIETHVRPGTRYHRYFGPTHQIETPSFDTTLWRYTDLARFLSLLEQEELFFARLDRLGDPFEGAWSEVNLRMIRSGLQASPRTEHHSAMEAWRTLVMNSREQRRYTLINCWHAGEHESEAMWKLYSGQGYGLAIRTDFKTLLHSFTERVPDIVGQVDYISYDTGFMPWSLRSPFLHKRLSFAHEREVRAVMQCFKFKAGNRPDVQAFDYSKDVCDAGLGFPVDPSELVQEVVISPYAESWMLTLVESVCERYGATMSVRMSDMRKDPVW